MRMRSPSSAPPDLRRDGSIEMIAMRRKSSWSSRNRRTSSSVSELLPAPPVPVMPSVGTRNAPRGGVQRRRAACGGTLPLSSPVMSLASARVRACRSPVVNASSDAGSDCARSTSQAATISLIMPCKPEPLAVLGREDARDAVALQLVDLGGDDDAAAAAEDLDVPGAPLAQQVEHVLEELDVAALVGRDRDAVRVLLDRAVDDLLDRAVVAEMDDLAPGRLQDPPHDVDRRIVTVEQARRGDEADLVDRLRGDGRAARIVHGRPSRSVRPGAS